MSKLFYEESYSFFNDWQKFLNEQAEVASMLQQAAADQERAEAEAQQKEQEIMAVRQSAGPIFAEFATMLLQLGQNGGERGSQRADIHIRDMAEIMSKFAGQDIGVEEFLEDINNELIQTGQSLQRVMPK
jgi:hypothetical protein